MPVEAATDDLASSYLRDAIAGKLEGAPGPAVRDPGVPSGTNLLGV